MSHPFSRRQILAVVAALALPSCRRTPASASTQLTGHTMGGTWSVKIPHLPPSLSSGELQQQIQSLLDNLDNTLSLWKPQSPVCQFNRSAGTDWHDVPADLADIVGQSLAISRQTNGAFDITIAPLVILWGFGPRASEAPPQPPADSAIAQALAHVGHHRLHVRLNPPAIRKDTPGLQIDLGAIGKGYTADAVASLLDRLAIPDYLIDIGGQLKARGHSPASTGWPIGIEEPTPDSRRVLCAVNLRNQSIATSGDYHNFYDAAGKRYCHEIDPRTGRPVADPPASVSVLHSNGATADALATAFMVLGMDAGIGLANRQNLSALFIRRQSGSFDRVPSSNWPG